VSTPDDLIESSKSPENQSRPASTKFAYAALNQGLSLAPAIEVEVEGRQGTRFPFRMLPDSGASGTVFPRKHAVPLGFDLRDCEPFHVDTGNGRAKHWRTPRPVKALIAEREVLLSPCFGNIGVPVLGREDFFAEFYVEVDEVNRFVKITPHEFR
jgi:hypothetical protein